MAASKITSKEEIKAILLLNKVAISNIKNSVSTADRTIKLLVEKAKIKEYGGITRYFEKYIVPMFSAFTTTNPSPKTLKIHMGNFVLAIEADTKAGAASAGVSNELYLVEKINDQVREAGGQPITVRFLCGNRVKTIPGIIKAEHKGADSTGHKKADLELVTYHGNRKIPISVKDVGAGFWESATAIFTDRVAVLERAIADDKVKIEKNRVSGETTLDKPIISNMTDSEKASVIFGEDLTNNDGFVIIQKFNNTVVSWYSNSNTLDIEVKYLLESYSDVPAELDPVFIIGNAKGRVLDKASGYYGLRAQSIPRHKINAESAFVNRPVIAGVKSASSIFWHFL